ncbi:N-acetylmuramoyl-L-alanine amidase [Sulfitobacter donghicola]|uniref:N-acetylmuramoyl-L-alanine amidase n=1 Tax=Sulfitobacter donghicola DSW-25 = KCTC 12864 = JCM 14565 TaxID=1300350 RepID=A0A073IEH2_9RHOB|nr:N-acetylmuramoyl-L-alanine amidase [Sulfitobacter donghicola]KEJ87950.1 N-acetylmuramoyl-L-alanine amidase [Sulfitobacter donghicola DSW-25 = KCTC 12864 = JCM 14565]
MKTVLLSLICALAFASHAVAQGLTAHARVDAASSSITDGWWGRTELSLALSQGVPFRVFTLSDPARLVIDFREADFSGVTAGDILPEQGRVSAVRFGAFQPGWSRLVADLAEPMLPKEIGMPVDPNTGRATLQISLKTADEADFVAASGAPADPNWAGGFLRAQLPKVPDDGKFTVVIDPGHGGIDPGAEREGVSEKHIILSFARTLADALRRAGVNVVLTRDEDIFVALQTRVALAHSHHADLFISLHADILRQGGAKGATVYTLSEGAADEATQQLVARHDRSDVLIGMDLTGSDDQVAEILLDYARLETTPRSLALAQHLAAGMAEAGGPMNRRPLREAGFSVLKSADIPSVLVEIGFLSSDRDLANLSDPIWRQGMAEGITKSVLAWRDADEANAALIRQ